MEVYTRFIDQGVFLDYNANMVCNRVYEYMLSRGDVISDAKATLAITGTVAKIIQGAALSQVKVIPFVTADLQLFNYFFKGLAEYLGAKGVVKYSESLHMEVDGGIFIELWYMDVVGTILTVDTLTVQDVADIPAHIN